MLDTLFTIIILCLWMLIPIISWLFIGAVAYFAVKGFVLTIRGKNEKK